VLFCELMDDLAKLSNIHWKDAAAIETAITQKIPKLLASDQAYQNARKHSDPENIRIEGELAVKRAISTILSDYIELFQQFTQNADFKERLTSRVLTLIDGHRPD
jgi:type I restriction enzyme, R subunit